MGDSTERGSGVSPQALRTKGSPLGTSALVTHSPTSTGPQGEGLRDLGKKSRALHGSSPVCELPVLMELG